MKGLGTAQGEVKPGKEGGKEELTLVWCPSCAGYFAYVVSFNPYSHLWVGELYLHFKEEETEAH